MKFLVRFSPDSAGFFTSMLCAIHCSVVPVMVSMGLLSSQTWLHSHVLDWLVIGLGLIIASYSLVGDFIKKHRNYLPLSVVASGFILLLTGMIDHDGWMVIFSVIGGMLVATAHLINYRLVVLTTVKA